MVAGDRSAAWRPPRSRRGPRPGLRRRRAARRGRGGRARPRRRCPPRRPAAARPSALGSWAPTSTPVSWSGWTRKPSSGSGSARTVPTAAATSDSQRSWRIGATSSASSGGNGSEASTARRRIAIVQPVVSARRAKSSSGTTARLRSVRPTRRVSHSRRPSGRPFSSIRSASENTIVMVGSSSSSPTSRSSLSGYQTSSWSARATNRPLLRSSAAAKLPVDPSRSSLTSSRTSNGAVAANSSMIRQVPSVDASSWTTSSSGDAGLARPSRRGARGDPPLAVPRAEHDRHVDRGAGEPERVVDRLRRSWRVGRRSRRSAPRGRIVTGESADPRGARQSGAGSARRWEPIGAGP